MSFLFYNQNLLDQTTLANDYVSSEKAAFPIDNVYNKARRSKVWRSDGYFVVTASNNTIKFSETGPVLTATIAVGIYTSRATFIDAIAQALNDAGVSTYIGSLDASTLKMSLGSSLTGGATVFQLLTTNVGFTAAGIMGFSTSVDKTGASFYLQDVLVIHSNEWIKWDMGLSSNPQAFVLVGPRNEPIKITPGATIKLQGNETDVWTSPSYETTLTYDDEVIAIRSATGLHTEALRFWRLYIEDVSNPFGYLEVGCLFLGDYYESTRGKPQFGFTAQQIDPSTTVFSEGGQTYSDIRQKAERFSVEWFGLTKDEMKDLYDIFLEFGVSTPLFISFDPNGVISPSSNKYIRYCKFISEPVFTIVSPNNYRCTMELREEL